MKWSWPDIDEIPPENNLSEEEESFLKENADALSAFYTRHGKASKT